MIELNVNEQVVSLNGSVKQGTSDTIRYESCQFTISGTSWDALDSYDAIFFAEQLNVKKTIHLDSSRTCYIPWECLAGLTDVYVCVCGFNATESSGTTTVTYRITTNRLLIANVDQSLWAGGSGDTDPTPTQFEQFVSQVKNKVKEVEDLTVSATALPSGSAPTVTKTTGTVINLDFGLPQGIAGTDGRGITSIAKTSTVGLVDTYTITYSDSTTSTFTVNNGATGASGADGTNGRGITSIAKTGTSGLIDTYTITYTDATTTTFVVTNGDDGVDGVGIVSITKTGTAGLVDTYTITLSDGSTETFDVTNGASPVWGNITGTLSSQTDLQTALNAKANQATTYTKTETDTAISSHHDTTKVDVVSGKGLSTNDYDNTEKGLVASALQDVPNDGKSYARTHGSWVDITTVASVDWANVANKPSTFTPSTHTHDDRYYTETEMDASLLLKADKSDTYTKTQVDTAISGHHDSTKVDKIAGKGLSSNDFTDADRIKVTQSITDAPRDSKTWARRNNEWIEVGSGKSVDGVFVGTVVNGGLFPTTRLSGEPLQNDDWVMPAIGETFPIVVEGVTFYTEFDVAYYENGAWIPEPGIVQETSETPVTDKATESLSATSTTQAAINVENVAAINSKVRKIINKNGTRDDWADECTDNMFFGIGTFTDSSPTGELADSFYVSVSRPTSTDTVITASGNSGIFFTTSDGGAWTDWERVGKQVHYINPDDEPAIGAEDNVYIAYEDTEWATVGKVEKNLTGTDKWMKINPASGAQYIESVDYIMWVDGEGRNVASPVCFIEPASVNTICVECTEAEAQFKYEAKHAHLIPLSGEVNRALFYKCGSTVSIESKDTTNNTYEVDGITIECKDFGLMEMVRALITDDVIECNEEDADFAFYADYYDSTTAGATAETGVYFCIGNTGYAMDWIDVWKNGRYYTIMSSDNMSHVEGWSDIQYTEASDLWSIQIDDKFFNIPIRNVFFAKYESGEYSTTYADLVAEKDAGRSIILQYTEDGIKYYSTAWSFDSNTFRFFFFVNKGGVDKRLVLKIANTGTWVIETEQTFGYLPLTGDTMTGTIHAGTINIIDGSADDSYVRIKGGQTATTGGAALNLSGVSHSGAEGSFALNAQSSSQLVSLIGRPNGTLTWNTKNVITSVGGSMQGGLTFSTADIIDRNVDNGYITIKGGQSSTSGGAAIYLSGQSASGTEGTFQVTAASSSENSSLIGYPSGTLTWGGKSVLTSQSIVDNLTSEDTDKSLSANQGKQLNDTKIGKLSSMPMPSAAMVGQIYQFVGTTTSIYTNGFFYKVVAGTGGTYNWENIAVQPSGTACLPLTGGTMTGTIATENAIAMNNTSDTGSIVIQGGNAAGDGAQLTLDGYSINGCFTLKADDSSNSCELSGTPSGELTWGGVELAQKSYVAGETSLDVNLTTSGLSMLNVEGRLVAVMYYDNMFTVNGESVAVGGTAQVGTRTLTFSHTSGDNYYTVTANQNTYMSAILM